MRALHFVRSTGSELAAICISLLLLAAVTGCETERQRITNREDRLSAAGFMIMLANTPERQEMLARLPANKFVIRQHEGGVHYAYADPIVCGCLYLGTETAYNQYKANELAEHLANVRLLTAQEYSDAAWSWDYWGPRYPGGWRYGAGW